MEVGTDQLMDRFGQGQQPECDSKQFPDPYAASRVTTVVTRNAAMKVRTTQAETGRQGKHCPLCRRIRYSGSTGSRMVYTASIAITSLTTTTHRDYRSGGSSSTVATETVEQSNFAR